MDGETKFRRFMARGTDAKQRITYQESLTKWTVGQRLGEIKETL